MTELRFEREMCSRCWGSGEYSYCEGYGHTCFKCEGKREALTKRARIAARWMNEQNLIPASEVAVGMRIKACGLIINVKSIEEGTTSKSLRDGAWIENPRGLLFRGQKNGFDVPKDYMVQLIRSRADQVELLKRAIEYQNSLTKEGKPRKLAA